MRQLAADMGLWDADLEALHTPYIYPSENGLRCDTRHLKLGAVSIEGRFHFGVSRYSQENLARAQHTSELTRGGTVYVRLDGWHMGVGGDDSWSPSAHEDFLLRQSRYRYSLTFSGR